jgi:hypothetical protein
MIASIVAHAGCDVLRRIFPIASTNWVQVVVSVRNCARPVGVRR